MNGFDLVSRVFALVLGLGIAEVLGGFARTWRVKARAEGDPAKSVHTGTLVPLLGLLVVTDQTGFWLAFYSLRDHLPFNFAGLVGVMAIIGLYYIISTFVFPQETERWPDFDDYYLLVRRTVVGGMIAVKIATLAYAVVLFAWGVAIKNETGTTSLAGNTASLLFLPTLVALLFVSSKRASAVLLGFSSGYASADCRRVRDHRVCGAGKSFCAKYVYSSALVNDCSLMFAPAPWPPSVTSKKRYGSPRAASRAANLRACCGPTRSSFVVVQTNGSG